METVGIYQISLSECDDYDAFENFMETVIFPTVNVGNQTRGGIVKAQCLLKNDPYSKEQYAWLVRWEDQGGSPFGATNAPPDPTTKLSRYGAEVAFTRYTLVAEELE